MTIHLHPTAPLADCVLLPGDPGRALLLAQLLLDEPRMFNHNRGLWGYTGNAADGRALTIQSTGMGGPSAAIVITELAQLGAERLVRVGTCGTFGATFELGDLLVATGALAIDGTSRALGAEERVSPDLELAQALLEGAAVREGTVASTDLFYDDRAQALSLSGADALDMETATLFTLAPQLALRAASLLIVSDLILPTRNRIAPDALDQAERAAGRLAATALGIKSG